MRKWINILGIVAVAAAVVAMSTPATEASCSPAKLAGSTGYSVGGYGYAYTIFAGTAGNSSGFVNGRLWQTNSPGINEGTSFDPNSGLFGAPYGGPDAWNFLLNLGAAGVGGALCPSGCLSVYFENPQADGFILWTTDEGGVNSSLNFDFTTVVGGFAVVAAGVSPRPRVTSSSRTGTDITVNYNMPNVAAGINNDSANCPGAESMQLHAINSAGPPSLNAAGWSARGGSVGTGGANGLSEVFDCSNTANDWWIATRFTVGGQAAHFVSSPVQIECDPTFAEPGPGEFKRIERQTNPRRRERE